jgi:hypothetical protein
LARNAGTIICNDLLSLQWMRNFHVKNIELYGRLILS